MDLEKLEWISVEERLPREQENVWVLGVLDESIPVCLSDGNSRADRRPMQTWICKRAKNSQFTDGNGFLRIFPNGEFVITHWFPIPRLNGTEIYETLPDDGPAKVEAIDLGLPSGTKWANMNVGAKSPTDYGLYFAWGDTQGYSPDDAHDFSWDTYENSPAGSIQHDLALSEDAAHIHLGGDWRMPTADEFQELYDNCNSEWTEMDGVKGRLFTSKINGDKVFLPASGYYNGSSLNNRGSNGYYWSSTRLNDTNAYSLFFGSGYVDPQDYNYRYYGLSVRPVQ